MPDAPDDEAQRIARGLTKAQAKALLWLQERDHNRSEWTKNGKKLRASDGPETWSHLRISGVDSILIAESDLKALRDLKEPAGAGVRHRMWVLSPLGLRVRAALLAMEARDA